MSKRESTEKQIEDLTVQLKAITRQLEALKVQVQQEQQEAVLARRTSLEQRRQGLQIGDRARITNGYQGLRGTTGIVVKLSTSFVTIRTDYGKEIVRGKQNVLRIIPDNE